MSSSSIFSYRILIRTVSLALCWATAAHAQGNDSEETYPSINMLGFGTLGMVYHDQKNVQFRRDVSEAGTARAGRVSFSPDSKLGIQLTALIRPDVEATVQVVSGNDYRNSATPEVTWAYLKYRQDNNITYRLGRLGIEVYLQGDAAEIGYANLLIRQPISIYPRSFDGADVEKVGELGPGVYRVKGAAGWTVGKLLTPSGQPYDAFDALFTGMGVEYILRGWTTRFCFGQVRYRHELEAIAPEAPLPALLTAVNAPNRTKILDALSSKNRLVNYASLAMGYDEGPLQLIASYDLKTTENRPDRREFYTIAGYRIGDFTPYVAYSSQHTARTFIASGVASNALNQAVALAQAGTMVNQSDTALGIRYDFAANTALKIQVDRIRYRDPASLIDTGLTSSTAETRGYRAFILLSAVLDFTF